MLRQPLSTDDMALKTLTRLLIEQVGGLEAAATYTRVNRSVLSGYQNPHQPHFMPVDVVGRLEHAARRVPITEELARRAGYSLVQPGEVATESVPLLMARFSQEAAELHQAFAEGLADGELCARDDAALEREVTHVLRKATRLLAALHAKRGLSQLPGLP
ncbi:phage regulatory CII family protein [Teichococcus aestuarii]|uniref:phage regulatory CII family protein n=1 Tax=Teichococcus aestuarii TaxID=568898 RepID=UPI00361909B4